MVTGARNQIDGSLGAIRAWPTLLAAAAFVVSGLMPATVQTASAQIASQSISVPPGPLTPALNRLAAQTGVQILFDARLANGKTTRGVQGNMTASQALTTILAGTGLSARSTGANAITITRPGNAAGPLPSGTVQLDVIEVQGNIQSPYGPGDGYVATRSASASKTDTPIIETPQSISIVTRQQMDDRSAQNLNEVLRYTSGVQVGDTGDLTTESFAIRGYNSPYLSLYRDGTRAMFRAFDSITEPYGLERVEVLKGPASVLYGQGIPGGLVNLVTKRPTDTALREIQMQAGSFNRRQAAGDFGGPVEGSDNNLLYRFTFVGRKSDTQIDYVPDDRLYIAPAVTIRSPSRDTTLTLLSGYQNDRTSFPDGLPAQGTVLPNPNGKIPVSRFTGEPDWSKFTRNSYWIGYIFDHQVNDAFSLHQTTRYTKSDYDRNQVQNRGLDIDLETIARRARQGFQNSDRFNADTRAQYKFVTGPVKHNVIAGIDYSWANLKTRMSQGNIAGLNIISPQYGASVATPDQVFDDSQTATQAGLYLQEQAKLWDRLNLIAGVRKDWASDRLVDFLPGGVTTTQKDSAVTYRFGAIYETPVGLAPYVSYTQSFTPVSGYDRAGQQFKPETGEQHEIGVKYEPPSKNGSVTVSAFNLVRNNVQTPDPADLDFFIQTGQVTTRGLEFEGAANLTREINLIAAYTLNDSKVTKSNDIDLGKRPTTVPNHLASTWINYSFKSGPLDGAGFGAGVRYVGNTPGDMANTFFTPSHTLLDVAVRYQIGKFRFAINANNVFDKIYVSSCFSSDSCYFGMRRSIIGTATYTW